MINLSKVKDETPEAPALSEVERYGQKCLIEGIRVASEYLEHGLKDGGLTLYGPADPEDIRTAVEFLDDTYNILRRQHEDAVR